MRFGGYIRHLLAAHGLVVTAWVALVSVGVMATLWVAAEVLSPPTIVVLAHAENEVAAAPPPAGAEAGERVDTEITPTQRLAESQSADASHSGQGADTRLVVTGEPTTPIPSSEAAAGALAPGDAGAGAASATATPLATPTAEPTPTPTPSPSPNPLIAHRLAAAAAPRGAPRPKAELPILMYHHVGLLPPNPDAIRRDLTVSPEHFEQQLAYFAETGIETVTLDDLMNDFEGGPVLPKRAVALTFDDGYDDNYEYAFKLLQQHGMVGTFFVITDFVEKPGYLTWDQIKEMSAAGMAIEAHTVDHPDLTAISPAALRRQLDESKQTLEEALGQPCRFLAYPSGKYNANVVIATRAAGYAAAVTVQHGTIHTSASPFELHRVRARGSDSVKDLVGRMTPPSWQN